MSTTKITTSMLEDGAVTSAKVANANITEEKLAASAVTTAKVADSGITTAKIADANVTPGKLVNSGYELGSRNVVINGAMEISQRGTSFAAIADAAYSVDRWIFGNSSAAVLTASQETDAPADSGFINSLRLTVTTADAAIAAGDSCVISQRIEGYNIRRLLGEPVVVSFWVKSSKTGTHCIAMNNNGNDRSYVATYSITAANTWEYKQISVPSGLTTAGTWNYTNGIGLRLRFILAAGSTYQTTANTWQTGNFFCTSSQVNCLDNIGNVFAITGVQLEPGTVATPFERRSYGIEFALCQRYFEQISVPNSQPLICAQAVSSANAWGGLTPFKVTKRGVPSVAYSGTLVSWNSAGTSAGGTIAPYGIWEDGFNWRVTLATGLTAGNAAQIVASGGDVTISASAEL